MNLVRHRRDQSRAMVPATDINVSTCIEQYSEGRHIFDPSCGCQRGAVSSPTGVDVCTLLEQELDYWVHAMSCRPCLQCGSLPSTLAVHISSLLDEKLSAWLMATEIAEC